ncbi:MAG: glycosyltransferase [Spirochaetia bacterium]|jgi:glycosyltransferase involved in cell wall biosynthesis|nr:glycosyltransferase [Spirochaetia bacterium]
MKILHIINSLASGGAERLISTLLPRFASRGNDVYLYALDGRDDVYSKQLSAKGIKVTIARDDGSNIYSPMRFLELRDFMSRDTFDVVHSHLGPSFHWTTLSFITQKARYIGAKLITTEHAVHNRRMKMPILRNFERWLYKKQHRIICVSEEVASSMQMWLSIPATRLPVIPNGIDLHEFGAAVSPDADVTAWARGRTVVSMTARFIPEKRHETALRALRQLPERFAGVFIGDGPLRPSMERLAADLGLTERCYFTGTKDTVPELLAASDYYMQPSETEGFGLGCLEAMASNIPVVASAAGGLRDLVQDAGLLFPPGDHAACAQAILGLDEDKKLKDKVLAAQAHKVTKYSIENCVDKYLKLYENSLVIQE